MSAFAIPRYFLGANSPSGFLSLYDELLPQEQRKDLYILKGGPGCGKSTLMRRVGALLEQQGIPREEILCSSDPDSLDAVIFPALGAAIVDGTAPHVVECHCPAAVDLIVNLGIYYRREALRPQAEALTRLMQENKNCYERATRCLAASRLLREDLRTLLLPHTDLARLRRKAEGFLRRELRGAPRGGHIRRRYLSGATPKGLLLLEETVCALCSRRILLEDTWGLAPLFLAPLVEYAQQEGIETVICCCPQDPGRSPEHLLFPTLDLALVRTAPQLLWTAPYTRRLRLDPLVAPSALQKHRQLLRTQRKLADSLFTEALSSIRSAKTLHDEIEAIYTPHVDFSGVEQEARRIADALLSRRN